MTQRDIDLTEVFAELNSIVELAEWGIANERLGGNVVKEEFWNGQRVAALHIRQWLTARAEDTVKGERK